MAQDDIIKAVTVVSKDLLPLCCPLPGTEAWNMHPRVYLPIDSKSDKIIACPYCGAKYALE